MKLQRGFIELSMMDWAAIAAGAVILLLGLAVKVQTDRLHAVQAEYGQFKGGVEALGAAAEDAKAKKEAEDKKRKENADAENSKTIAGLNADIKRLRDERSGRSFLPVSSPGSKRPSVACFDRTQFESALQRFDSRTADIVAEGDAERVNLDTAKRWAQP